MGVDMRIYKSHPDKLLSDHLRGVVEGTRQRTSSKAAEIASLFHDLGKINPNFQHRLQGERNTGYSSHAYLSALAWLYYCHANAKSLKDLIGIDPQTDSSFIFSIAAMIARHHGNLPNLEKDGFFSEREQKRLRDFLVQSATDDLPISEFLKPLILECREVLTEFNHFDMNPSRELLDHLIFKFQSKFHLVLQRIDNPLEFFMDTQFGFACLIESDKRDAGNNTQFNKAEYGKYIKQNFATQLEKHLQSLPPRSSFDSLRTKMRVQAVENVKANLAEGKRVFTLSAPTGAGKTLMLLSIASEILKHDDNLSIIYALPFLSITEQTESICQNICNERPEAILRIDSKSENKQINKIQRALDENPTDHNLRHLMREIFSENTFDHPFIITTFVQVFEALVSNRNSTLLRLPNFARAVFLLDEIQALPPRLYTFFTAYIDEFCRKFDSYAVISTATMPYVELPEKDIEKDENPRILFRNYEKPCELLSRDFYERSEFNRYRINRIEKDSFCVSDLAAAICQQSKSSLVILNTIDDTKHLFDLLKRGDGCNSDDKIILLNTHFTPNDRREKLEFCKCVLDAKQKVVLISTQLIEAGVDIDFPVLYRDMCPLPNLIQSAGRCNRNGKEPFGEVFLTELKKENGQSSASYIYGRDLKWFLDFTKQYIRDTITEKEMFDIQRKFFQQVGKDLYVGLHKQGEDEINMVKCINHIAFDDLGKFRLIDKEFGEELRYYIKHDGAFDELERRVAMLDYKEKDYNVIAYLKSKVEEQLRLMAGNVVAVRVRVDDRNQVPPVNGESCCGLHLLADLSDYSSIYGVRLSGSSGNII